MADEFDAIAATAPLPRELWAYDDGPVSTFGKARPYFAAAFRAAWQARRCDGCDHWERREKFPQSGRCIAIGATKADAFAVTAEDFSCAGYAARPAAQPEQP